MEIRIHAIHFEATERLRDFIVKKAERFARRAPATTILDAKLSVVKPETVLNKEVVMTAVAPQQELVATKVANTFEEAVDLCFDAIERQLDKLKEKK